MERIISGIDQEDAKARYQVEEGDNNTQSPNSSTASVDTPRKVISWEDGDPECPYNWSTVRTFSPLSITRIHVSQRKKSTIVLIGMVIVINSTMGSSLPSNAIPIISKHFGITSSYAEILPISIYLVGYIVGPLGFGPLSESFGRQIIMISTFVFFTIFTMACAVAPTWGSLLVFRFFTGVCASSPIAVIGGIYADLYDNPVTRGRAMAVFIGVSLPFLLHNISTLIQTKGHMRRPSRRPRNIWLHRPRPRLALGLLDRSNLRRRLLASPPLPPRNILTRAFIPARCLSPLHH